ncbi:D-alanyl-D-alanine carboxypeptidase family protein [Cohnella laeviribosi]|uniref:D-alanyl-D-alanine carboxypeptidase family protein n=1 Tax=Cohnella laeviribosi TaxID=380174 RepID=UPI000362504E|nr:D-alanyl-D-alanine carboxypeptidase family protein [Cohnella laeviribosi]
MTRLDMMAIWRFIIPILIVFFLIEPVSASEEKPRVRGEAAVLIDAKTGTILYEKNADTRLYPASITKIATGIVAIESSNIKDTVKVSKEARYEEGTRVFLAEGEEVTLENLLYGLLVNSGNDAATAIAEYIDGSKEQFAIRMNEFVRDKVGVTQTHFTNPHGLPDPNHYTTARDMAFIAKYAMKNDLFRQIVSTKTKPWTGKEWKSELVNHNKLLWSYEGANGIKNGYTNAAGFTLVSSARRGDTELIGVILKASSNNELYADMTELLDYGFENFESRLVMAKGEQKSFNINQKERVFYSQEPIWLTLHKGIDPVLTVDDEGSLYVQNSPLISSSEAIATLYPVKQEQEQVPDLSELPMKIMETSAPDRKSPWTIAITGVWFLQLAFMFMLILAIRRKKKSLKRNRYYE